MVEKSANRRSDLAPIYVQLASKTLCFGGGFRGPTNRKGKGFNEVKNMLVHYMHFDSSANRCNALGQFILSD
jgi:hypothetical protein